MGTATSKTAGTQLAVALSAGASVGDVVAVWVAWDNETATAAETGPSRAQLACTDSQGNIYWGLSSVQQSGSSTHTSCAIFLCRVRTALTTSDTITLDNLNSLTAKAASAHKFTMDSTKRWACATQIVSLVTSAADPGSLSLSGLVSKPYLLLHGLAGEGPTTDAYTWDADYTQIAGAGTTGGTDDSNQHIRGGYRIATLTSDTVDVASTTADRDYVQVFCALVEADYDSTFPVNPVLDDFNRANETPIGGDWNPTCSSDPDDPGVGTPGGLLKIVSNEAAVDGSGLNEHGGQWWDYFIDAADAEVFCTIATLPSGTPTNQGARGAGVQIHGSGCGSSGAPARSGQAMKWERQGSLTAPVDKIRLGTLTTFTIGSPLINAWRNNVAGNKIGLQRKGHILNAWINEGSGWQWIGALDYQINASFLTGFDKLGLEMTGSEVRADDFGGGPVADFVPQIIRRVCG